MKFPVTFIFFLLITAISFSQVDTAKFATLYIYHSKDGAFGSFTVFLNDSAVCKLKYNSRNAIRIDKEGIVELRIKNKQCKPIVLDVKHGEAYYLRCYLDAKENDFVIMGKNIKPLISLVDPVIGQKEFNSTEDRNELKNIKKQDTIPRRNTIYAEVGGQAGLYSINYDRIYRLNKKVKHSISFGLELIPFDKYYFFLVTPICYNFLFGKKKNNFELGIGLTNYINSRTYPPNTYFSNFPPYSINSTTVRTTDYILFATPKICYRYQKLNGSLFLKFSFSPIANIVGYYDTAKYKMKAN